MATAFRNQQANVSSWQKSLEKQKKDKLQQKLELTMQLMVVREKYEKQQHKLNLG